LVSTGTGTVLTAYASHVTHIVHTTVQYITEYSPGYSAVSGVVCVHGSPVRARPAARTCHRVAQYETMVRGGDASSRARSLWRSAHVITLSDRGDPPSPSPARGHTCGALACERTHHRLLQSRTYVACYIGPMREQSRQVVDVAAPGPRGRSGSSSRVWPLFAGSLTIAACRGEEGWRTCSRPRPPVHAALRAPD
jgi:hypothetical protein